MSADRLPRSQSGWQVRLDADGQLDRDFMEAVVERWRGATMSNRLKMDERWEDLDAPSAAPAPPLESERVRPPTANMASDRPASFARPKVTFGR